ncbi:hypothetical protein C0J52_01612 [Blattella germanica]|nr:hypothetical protein C0J52_01612 [Blattella germanica]
MRFWRNQPPRVSSQLLQNGFQGVSQTGTPEQEASKEIEECLAENSDISELSDDEEILLKVLNQ